MSIQSEITIIESVFPKPTAVCVCVCSDCPQKNKTIEENSMEIYLGALLAECFDVYEVGFIIRKGLG